MRLKSEPSKSHVTKMSDELLGDVHPLEKFLKEAVRKALLDRGNVLLHVLQSPETGGRKRKHIVNQNSR